MRSTERQKDSDDVKERKGETDGRERQTEAEKEIEKQTDRSKE